MLKKKNKSYNFFLTDNSGNLYKATAFDEKEFELEDEEELEEKKEELEKKEEVKDDELVLTPEEIAFVKKLYAEHKAEEEAEVGEGVEEEIEEKEEVIDTAKANDSKKAIGSIEPSIKMNDTSAYDYQNEVAKAWAARIKKEN